MGNKIRVLLMLYSHSLPSSSYTLSRPTHNTSATPVNRSVLILTAFLLLILLLLLVEKILWQGICFTRQPTFASLLHRRIVHPPDGEGGSESSLLKKEITWRIQLSCHCLGFSPSSPLLPLNSRRENHKTASFITYRTYFFALLRGALFIILSSRRNVIDPFPHSSNQQVSCCAE